MRVALLTLTSGAVSGGYAKYLREVVPRLTGHHAVRELRVYTPPPMADLDRGYRTWPTSGAFATARWLRREMESWQPDVVFIPSSVHISFGAIPVVTMVRNMEPLDHPFSGNSWNDGVRNLVRAALARRACERSARVIAVSEHVREALVSRWSVDAGKIAVVPHGVEAGGEEKAPAALADGAPFVFAAGSIRPARGLEDLLGARAAIPPDYRVAIAGGVEAEAYAASLRTMHNGDERVVWLGKLSEAEMAWCFRSARAFVMTSRAEACPNIVLEALAHGSLSISTDQEPMPEFYGDSAVYYRAGDAADLQRALGSTLALGREESAALRDRALLRSRLYTWQATVQATVGELQKAVSYNTRLAPGPGA